MDGENVATHSRLFIIGHDTLLVFNIVVTIVVLWVSALNVYKKSENMDTKLSDMLIF